MRIDVVVDDPSGGVLEQIEGRLDNPRPGLELAAEAVQRREARIFATAGGGTWDPLAQSTIARKGSARVLVDDGGLLRDLTTSSGRQTVIRYDGDSLFVGTRNPVASLHRVGARGMPRRDPVPPTTPAERDEIVAPLLGYVVEGVT